MSKKLDLAKDFKEVVSEIKALKKVIRKYKFNDVRLVEDTQLLIILRAQRDSISSRLSN